MRAQGKSYHRTASGKLMEPYRIQSEAEGIPLVSAGFGAGPRILVQAEASILNITFDNFNIFGNFHRGCY